MGETQFVDAPFNSTSFQQFLAEGRLMGSRCKRDGALFLPPRSMCPADFSSEMEWVEFSGRARLVAFSVIHIGTSAMLEAGFDRQHPYCSGVVALEEGPQISAQILGVDVLRPDTIRIGMPLEAVFAEREPGDGQQVVLAFRPA
jgi:hypothetical protein